MIKAVNGNRQGILFLFSRKTDQVSFFTVSELDQVAAVQVFKGLFSRRPVDRD